jgi:predicted  nucleic acid-binding Zn-ribbon protein
MTHCTVCGAAAREGAKFCTSCGARLVDTVATAPASDDTAIHASVEPDVSDAPDTAPDERQEVEAETIWASTVTGSATGEVESVPVDTAEPEPVAAPGEQAEYTASWPEAGDEAPVEGAPAGAVADSGAQPDAAWASWSDTATEPTEPTELPASEPVAEPGEPDAVDGMEASHHGASQWESWAPEASGEATVPASGSDVGASVRRLLDDVANRIDRLIDPATVASRGVDVDELADQLGRWSRTSTDAAGLLEVVRAVRTSPRDVDALMRLADRAPDLELLVRHYQAITTGAGDWASRLRAQDTAETEDT